MTGCRIGKVTLKNNVSTVRAIEPPASQSDHEVVTLLRDAMHEAHDNKVVSAAVFLEMADFNYSGFAIIKKVGTYGGLLGGLDILKSKIIRHWEQA